MYHYSNNELIISTYVYIIFLMSLRYNNTIIYSLINVGFNFKLFALSSFKVKFLL